MFTIDYLLRLLAMISRPGVFDLQPFYFKFYFVLLKFFTNACGQLVFLSSVCCTNYW